MEVKNLYTLKTILEEGSFQNAAVKLGYTQSTITFQIRQLEEELGVVLFEKIGRRMVLSQAGENLIPYIDETLFAFERLRNVGKELSEMTGTKNYQMVPLSPCLITSLMKKQELFISIIKTNT